eukprot:3507246-Rhodomonas_salina.2
MSGVWQSKKGGREGEGEAGAKGEEEGEGGGEKEKKGKEGTPKKFRWKRLEVQKQSVNGEVEMVPE